MRIELVEKLPGLWLGIEFRSAEESGSISASQFVFMHATRPLTGTPTLRMQVSRVDHATLLATQPVSWLLRSYRRFSSDLNLTPHVHNGAGIVMALCSVQGIQCRPVKSWSRFAPTPTGTQGSQCRLVYTNGSLVSIKRISISSIHWYRSTYCIGSLSFRCTARYRVESGHHCAKACSFAHRI